MIADLVDGAMLVVTIGVVAATVIALIFTLREWWKFYRK